MTIDEMIRDNIWHDLPELDQVISFIKDAAKFYDNVGNPNQWAWYKNPHHSVKYITIKVDMRDGGFVITDDDGDRVSLDQIKEQFASLV